MKKKFKVCDRVRILDHNHAAVVIGSIGRIVHEYVSLENNNVYVVVMENPIKGFEHSEWKFLEEHLELFEDSTNKPKFKVGDRIKLLDVNNSLFEKGDTGTVYELSFSDPLNKLTYAIKMDKDTSDYNRRWFFDEKEIELLNKPVEKADNLNNKTSKKPSKPIKYFLIYVDENISKVQSFDSKKDLTNFCNEFSQGQNFKRGNSWLEYVFKGYGAKVKVEPSIKFEGME